MSTNTKRGKRKRPTGFETNLKRFKGDIRKFNEENENALQKVDSRMFDKKSQMTRKERRKEERKLKKMRMDAFKRQTPIPTTKTLETVRMQKQQAEKKRLHQQEKRHRKKLRKRDDRRQVKQEEALRVQGLAEANKKEDKVIKELEKQLYLKKRKSKNLPQGFINDGLDYLLEIIDPEKLKTIYNEGDEADATDLPGLMLSDEEADSDDNGSSEKEDSDQNLQSEDDEDDGEDEDGDSSLSEEENAAEEEDEESEDEETDAQFHEDQDDSNLVDDSEQVKSSEISTSCKKRVKFQDLEVKKATSRVNISKEASKEPSDNDSNVEENDTDEESEEESENENDNNEESDNEDESNESDDDGEVDHEEDGDESNDPECKSKVLVEDIYGRLRNKEGEIVVQEEVKPTGYIPPAKRLAMAHSSDEKKKLELERMKKQLKGSLNRLSEANLQSISNQIEGMFRQHSRAYLSESLTSLILEACVTPVPVPERLITEQIVLLAILHANIGTEVGATFLQETINAYQRFHQMAPQYGDGKEMNNLMVILSNLYNFKVIQSPIVFDILRKFMETFEERDIELILLVLRNVGFSLRKDDPETLKNLIMEIKQKATSLDTSQFEDESRVKFMLEVLMAIRNNNMRKIPNYDHSHVEHLRKLLRQYTTGSSSVDYQLRISLEYLLSSEEKGRWWLVGSAWAGKDTSKTTDKDFDKNSSVMPGVSQKILDLAAKQRMNTDIRKNIFCIIMMSEDFVDAFEKLLRLSLKQQQEREIIHVVMDLCMQENPYNPFYSYLAQKFCEYHRRFQMTVQFTTWDKLKVLHEVQDGSIINLAKFLTHLVACKAISLSIFKVVEFSELNKATLTLMKTVLTQLLTEFEEYTVKEVFSRIAPFTKLRILQDGLKLFMQHFILRRKGKQIQIDSLLKERVELAEKSLNSAQTALKL